jgi:signal peptidase I
MGHPDRVEPRHIKPVVEDADNGHVGSNGGEETSRRRNDALAECDRLLADATRVMRDARAVSDRMRDDTLAEVEAQAASLIAEAELARDTIIGEARRIRDEVLAETDDEAEARMDAARARAREVRDRAVATAITDAETAARHAEADAAAERRAREESFTRELEQRRTEMLDATAQEAERVLVEARTQADALKAAALAEGRDEVARLLSETLAEGRAAVDRLLADAADERARLLEEAQREVRELVRQAEADALLVRAEATRWFAERARAATVTPAPAVVRPEPQTEPHTERVDRPAPTVARPQPRRARRLMGEVLLFVMIPMLVAFLLKSYVAQAFYIPSASMEPKLEEGDRVIVSKLAYRLQAPSRGDVIVFHPPVQPPADRAVLPVRMLHGVLGAIGIRQPGDDTFIKRVVALPGETVEGRDGKVLVDGLPLDEPYLAAGVRTSDFRAVQLGDDELFVLGDNRPNSSDSRSFGPVQRDRVVGEATTRAWPPPRAGFL